MFFPCSYLWSCASYRIFELLPFIANFSVGFSSSFFYVSVQARLPSILYSYITYLFLFIRSSVEFPSNYLFLGSKSFSLISPTLTTWWPSPTPLFLINTSNYLLYFSLLFLLYRRIDNSCISKTPFIRLIHNLLLFISPCLTAWLIFFFLLGHFLLDLHGYISSISFLCRAYSF